MKIKVVPKQTPKIVRYVYDEDNPDIIVGTWASPPVVTTDEITSTSTTGTSSPSPPVVKTTGQTGRYNYILNYVKKTCNVKYVYYYGHKYSWQNVIKYKKGNCCDLTRLVDQIAKTTGLPASAGDPLTERRYVRAQVYYKGSLYYTHVWNELKVNGQWKTLDMTHYILHGSTAVYGKIRSLTWRKNASGINPC